MYAYTKIYKHKHMNSAPDSTGPHGWNQTDQFISKWWSKNQSDAEQPKLHFKLLIYQNKKKNWVYLSRKPKSVCLKCSVSVRWTEFSSNSLRWSTTRSPRGPVSIQTEQTKRDNMWHHAEAAIRVLSGVFSLMLLCCFCKKTLTRHSVSVLLTYQILAWLI